MLLLLLMDLVYIILMTMQLQIRYIYPLFDVALTLIRNLITINSLPHRIIVQIFNLIS